METNTTKPLEALQVHARDKFMMYFTLDEQVEYENRNEYVDWLMSETWNLALDACRENLPAHDPYTREEMMSREGQNRDLDFLMCKKTGYNTYREEALSAIDSLRTDSLKDPQG